MDEDERRRLRRRQGAADAAPDRARRDRRDQLLSRERPRPPARHDRQPARLVHQPPAQLGRAAAVLPAQGDAASCTRDTLELIDRAAAIVEQGGVEAWSRARRAEDVLGAEASARANYAKSNDILDVWFDSGSTFFHVLRGSHPGTTRRRRRRPRGRPLPRRPRPAPRLVPLVAADRLRDRGPRAVPRPADARLHGRRLGPQDEQEPGQLHRACTKSTAKLGAEIIRLWCAATDYSGDLAIDDKILARVVDAYRRIRNTLRFLLANTSDFDAGERCGAARARCSRSTAGRWRARRSCRPRCSRTTRSTSSTRWSPSCRSSAPRTSARSTSTC